MSFVRAYAPVLSRPKTTSFGKPPEARQEPHFSLPWATVRALSATARRRSTSSSLIRAPSSLPCGRSPALRHPVPPPPFAFADRAMPRGPGAHPAMSAHGTDAGGGTFPSSAIDAKTRRDVVGSILWCCARIAGFSFAHFQSVRHSYVTVLLGSLFASSESVISRSGTPRHFRRSCLRLPHPVTACVCARCREPLAFITPVLHSDRDDVSSLYLCCVTLALLRSI